MSSSPISEIGRKATEASAKRITRPDHLALVIFWTAANATLPPARPVKKSQLTWNSCQARSASSPLERGDEQDQAEDGETAAEAEEELVLAGERPLDQALVDRAGTHRGRPPVEPVALGAGGIRAAAPAGSGGAGLCACSFRTWFTMAQRSAGLIDLVAVARHDAAAVADDAVEVAVAVRRGPGR